MVAHYTFILASRGSSPLPDDCAAPSCLGKAHVTFLQLEDASVKLCERMVLMHCVSDLVLLSQAVLAQTRDHLIISCSHSESQVSARAEARAVGLRVLRRAAAERAREEAAAKERRLVSMQLHHAGDGAQSSRPEPRKGQSCNNLMIGGYTINGQHD